MSNSGSSAGSASRLAAARLERSQIRAEAARKTPTTSSNSSYGNFWDPNSAQAPAGAPSAGGMPGQSAPAPAGAIGAGGVIMAEIGVPCVPLSSSEAFGVFSKEGALHENHDRGAACILPDRSTVLFACLDGHGAEGASVSGYALRNLLAGCASALQVRARR